MLLFSLAKDSTVEVYQPVYIFPNQIPLNIHGITCFYTADVCMLVSIWNNGYGKLIPGYIKTGKAYPVYGYGTFFNDQ